MNIHECGIQNLQGPLIDSHSFPTVPIFISPSLVAVSCGSGSTPRISWAGSLSSCSDAGKHHATSNLTIWDVTSWKGTLMKTKCPQIWEIVGRLGFQPNQSAAFLPPTPWGISCHFWICPSSRELKSGRSPAFQTWRVLGSYSLNVFC